MTSPAVDRLPPSGIERALDRTSGSRSIPDHDVTHLPNGPETLAAMKRAIGEAEKWLHFENYIIRHDRTGNAFAHALGEAASRGVRVRVLYDDFGCRATEWRFWRALRQRGVEVRAYNPVNPFRLIRSARRNHRKYVGTDGIRAIVGGVCIGDEWSGDETRKRMPWRDTAVEVRGRPSR